MALSDTVHRDALLVLEQRVILSLAITQPHSPEPPYYAWYSQLRVPAFPWAQAQGDKHHLMGQELLLGQQHLRGVPSPIPRCFHSCPSGAAFLAAGVDLLQGKRCEDTDSAGGVASAAPRCRICPVPARGRVRPRVCGKMLFFPPLACPKPSLGWL